MEGYKIFIGSKDNFVNNYGFQFEEGKIYETSQEICPKKSGFHFAKRLEDTLRYGNAREEDVIICKVTALGKIIEYEDDYYGYYDIYVTDKIKVNNILSRKEIINYAINLPNYRLTRFIATMRLEDEEIKFFINRGQEILKYIDYYHFGNKEAFKIKKMGGQDGRKNI